MEATVTTATTTSTVTRSATSYLTGVVNNDVLASAHRPDLGLLITPDTRWYRKHIDAFGFFAADNGCFSQARVFDADRWVTWLDTLPRDRCLWATAPDVVGDHEATVARSAEWLPVLREMGFRAAFVVQNGATVENVPWDSFDVMFVGGVTECIPCGFTREAADFRRRSCPTCGAKLTEWKTSDAVLELVAEAKRRGIAVHVGRVNTKSRLEWSALTAAVDTADGTFVKFGPPAEMVGKLTRWLDEIASTLSPEPAVAAA